MTRQIVRFSYLQNTKLVVILYFLIGLIYVPIGLLMVLFGPEDQRGGGIAFLLMPAIGPIAAAVFTPVSIAAYNAVVKIFGGLEYTSIETDTNS